MNKKDYDSVVWPKPNPTVREQRMREFIENGTGQVNLEIRRENRNGLTFSAEVIEDLFDSMVALTAAKMLGEYEKTGKPPHTMRVKLKVDVES